MKPNPFRDELPDVALTLKTVANILMNVYRVIRMKQSKQFKDKNIEDLIADVCSEEEEQLVYSANDYAETLVGYSGDIVDYSTNEDEFVHLFDVKNDEYKSRLGAYIRKWCIPSNGNLEDCVFADFTKDFISHQYPNEVVQILRSLKYEEFLKTNYWKSVSRTMREGSKCEICGSTENLQIHHKTYEHHGYEHLYLEELQCLCKDCHLKVHHELNKKK